MASSLLDICHTNIRSLSEEKLDAIKAEIVPEFDVIMLTAKKYYVLEFIMMSNDA